jgi:hypothetical protein
VLSKEMQLVQELIAHPGWEIFKNLVSGKFKSQLNDKLMASARAGEQVNAAKFAGQIDILPVILALPEQELEKAMNKKGPTATD